MHENTGLIRGILGLPIFRSEWVLYLLIALSIISIGVMLERWLFYFRHKIDIDAVSAALAKQMDKGDFSGAAKAARRARLPRDQRRRWSA